MTSSLVGSEMCIRDRLMDMKNKSKGYFWKVMGTNIKRAKQELQQQMSSSSVSYTHLTLPTICSV
eukprot:10463246-Prorocentrum_lima.AAC.1